MYRAGFQKQSGKQKNHVSGAYDEDRCSISGEFPQNDMKKKNRERRKEIVPISKKRKIMKDSTTEILSSSKKSRKKKRKKSDLKEILPNKNTVKEGILLQLKKKVEKCNEDELYGPSSSLEPQACAKKKLNIEKIKRKKHKNKSTLLRAEERISFNHESKEHTLGMFSKHNGNEFSASFNEEEAVPNSKKFYPANNSLPFENESAIPNERLHKHFDVLSSDEDFAYGDITDLMVDQRRFSDVSDEENDIKNGLNNSSSDQAYNDIIEQNNPELADCEETELSFRKFRIGNDYCVVLNYSQSMSIFGFCDIRLLLGEIDVLGHTLTPISPKYTLYSPRGTALLTLRNTSKFNDTEIPLQRCMPHISDSNIKDIFIRKDSSVIIFSKRIDFKLNFVESHVSQKLLPEETQCPRLNLEPTGPWNKIHIPEEWNGIVSNISRTSKLFICGGKGVGKSTFLRYAVNRLLQKFGEVKVVDLDPGQSEFTVPGTLSIVTVKKPLLGVNYTHLKETERSILCDISVSQDPHKYIKCIENLIAPIEGKQENLCPTVINFMGFTSDMAFYLLSSAVIMLQPNKIIYLQSTNRKKNFKMNLTEEAIMNSSNFFNITRPNDLKFDIIGVSSITDRNMGWKLESRQVREMCLLAYFGQLMKEDVNSLQNCNLPAYVFDYKSISITNRDNVEVHVNAINANIVALCSLENQEHSIFQCYGWGIVRAVDPSQHAAVVITPIGNNSLKKITHFVTGCFPLPPSICMNNENVTGKIPYVVEGELIDFAQMSKRTHVSFKALKK